VDGKASWFSRLRQRKREHNSVPFVKSSTVVAGPSVPVTLRKSRIKTMRTGEVETLPWSYYCTGCTIWGHGYGSERGAKRGSNQHRCGRLHYNEVRL
jgi:hypothetical protein